MIFNGKEQHRIGINEVVPRRGVLRRHFGVGRGADRGLRTHVLAEFETLRSLAPKSLLERGSLLATVVAKEQSERKRQQAEQGGDPRYRRETLRKIGRDGEYSGSDRKCEEGHRRQQPAPHTTRRPPLPLDELLPKSLRPIDQPDRPVVADPALPNSLHASTLPSAPARSPGVTNPMEAPAPPARRTQPPFLELTNRRADVASRAERSANRSPEGPSRSMISTLAITKAPKAKGASSVRVVRAWIQGG